MSHPVYPLQMIQPEQWKAAERSWLSWDAYLSEKLVQQCNEHFPCLPFFKFLCEADLVKYFFYIFIAGFLWFSCKTLEKKEKLFLITSLVIVSSLGDVFSNLIKNIKMKMMMKKRTMKRYRDMQEQGNRFNPYLENRLSLGCGRKCEQETRDDFGIA